MSKNFERVKRDIMKDMENTTIHSPESWADIMLQNTQYLKTEQDQQDFWNWIINPNADRRKQLEFRKYNPNEIEIDQFQHFKVDDKDVTVKNTCTHNLLTTFIVTQPIDMDDEKDEKTIEAI